MAFGRSIIALHASFAAANNIDKFERFIFQGRASGEFALQTLEQACLDCATKLAEQLRQPLEELNVLLLSEPISLNQEQLLSRKFSAFYCEQNFSHIADYLAKYPQLAVIAISQDAESALPEKNTFSLDADFISYTPSSGVAGLVFASRSDCQKQGVYRYADVLAFENHSDVKTAANQAMLKASVTSSDIGYIELSANESASLLQQEIQGLQQAYANENRLHTALGSVRSVVGSESCFSQLAGLLKTVLLLQQRYFPATSDWQEPVIQGLEQSPFYVPVASSHWYTQHQTAIAAFSCQTSTHYSHLILQENTDAVERSNGYLASSDLQLILLSSDSQFGLQKQLETLQKESLQSTLPDLTRTYYQQFMAKPAAYTLCLLAESQQELEKEIALMSEGLLKEFAQGGEWKTPKGSYFTASPLNDNQGVSFLYPGIGATYVGLGRELFHLFPEIIQPITALADDIQASLKDSILNPRSLKRLSFQEIKAIDHDLRNRLADIAECGVGYACIFTQIFERVFGLKADFATGYSMGEISMYAALGCWEKPGRMSKRLAESETFNHRLTGELHTLREHWGLSSEIKDDERLWETYTLKGTLEEFQQAAQGEERVYCTIINTPDSIVIGGEPEACQRVIKRLGVRAMVLDMANAIHSPPAQKEYNSMLELYTMDVPERMATKLYSSSCYLPVPQRTKAIANSIAKCLCDPVDFPRLVNTMYDKGARVFLEMGPGRSLCSWLEKTLHHEGNKPHVSVPVNAKGTSDELTILRALAKLISHGIELDISRLYYGSLLHNNNKTTDRRQAS